MAARYDALGPWRSVERRVLVALLVTALLWITPSILSLFAPAASEALSVHLPESVVPVLVAGVLFWLPQGDGVQRPVMDLGDLGGIDWPVVVLFGGGMCLGQLMMDTGVAAALGKLLASYVPAGHSPQLVFMFCLLAIAVSETTSNTASANMVVPVVIAVSTQAGADPIRLGLAATVGLHLRLHAAGVDAHQRHGLLDRLRQPASDDPLRHTARHHRRRRADVLVRLRGAVSGGCLPNSSAPGP